MTTEEEINELRHKITKLVQTIRILKYTPPKEKGYSKKISGLRGNLKRLRWEHHKLMEKIK